MEAIKTNFFDFDDIISKWAYFLNLDKQLWRYANFSTSKKVFLDNPVRGILSFFWDFEIINP